MQRIAPQPGPQEDFLASTADIAIFGAAAGVGKTFALLMEPLRNAHNKDFGAVVFRRTMPQIKQEGGLWDTAKKLYIDYPAEFIMSPYRVTFPAGAKVEFHQLQYDDSVSAWDGSQIPLILFDELQHFTEYQFFYMLSRNRTTCGIQPYVRATCNPDPNSFLRKFLSWWINESTGFPIPERSGVIRWMLRLKNVIHWGDTREELINQFKHEYDVSALHPKSVTFIPASLDDNKILLEKNPSYKGNLMALPEYEQQRLLKGNWNARPVAGDLFRRKDFELVEAYPPMRAMARYWDRAATRPSEDNPDPDYTAGALVGLGYDGYYYVLDLVHLRDGPFEVRTAIKNTASQDGKNVSAILEQDPGQAGKVEVAEYARALAGYPFVTVPVSEQKFIRWKPFAAQVRAGNVKILKGSWNSVFFNELEALTDNPKDYLHDDIGDAVTGAFNYLTLGASGDMGTFNAF